MEDLVGASVDRLKRSGVRLDKGLSDDELARVEQRFDFTFGPEHRELLSAVLPVEDSWVDWRRGSRDHIDGRLAWPIDSVIFDVHNNSFWPSSWGDRPAGSELAEDMARRQLTEVPRLIPVFGHRYLPSDPTYVPSPVFSVYQTDVIYYGDNLV